MQLLHPYHFIGVADKLKDLPVAAKVDEVVNSVKSGELAVLTAETASGKTLLASSKLADASDHQVVVLVPSRFLAVDAARNIAKMSGIKLEDIGKDAVGFAIGNRADETANFTPNTKLVFATYGYALKSGLLETAKTVVCDEVHEAGIDISVARALLYQRLQKDPSLCIMEMSATLDAPRQAAFWHKKDPATGKDSIAKTRIFHAEGKPYRCDVRQETEKSVINTVSDLIVNHNSKGVAVFLEGVKEVKAAASNLRALLDTDEVRKQLDEKGIKNVEIATVYGDMDAAKRDEATKAPDGLEPRVDRLIDEVFKKLDTDVKKKEAFDAIKKVLGLDLDPLQCAQYIDDKVKTKKRLVDAIRVTYPDDPKHKDKANAPDKMAAFLSAVQHPSLGLSNDNPLKIYKSKNVKVLIGTNVIESGVNILWLDSGVSNGKGNVPYHRKTGARALVTEDLPQWRIIQQKGRVSRVERDTPSIFVLNAKMAMEDRPKENSPELSRVSPTGLVMHTAGYGLNPLKLNWDAPVSEEALICAKKDLSHLKLMSADVKDWSLTEKGKFVHSLPLGAETGSMLWKAPKDILGDAIALASIIEMEGLREDKQQSHQQDKNSDMLDALKIFKILGKDADEQKCYHANVKWKSYNDVKETIKEVRHRLGIAPDMKFRRAHDAELVELMLKGGVNHLFELKHKTVKREGRGNNIKIPSYGDLVTGYDDFRHDDASVVNKDKVRFAIANLYELPSGKTIAKDVTNVPPEALLPFAVGERLLSEPSLNHKKHPDSLRVKYLGRTPIAFDIPQKNIPPEMRQLMEEAKRDGRYHKKDQEEQRDKPKGRGNTQAREAKKQQKRDKREERRDERRGRGR